MKKSLNIVTTHILILITMMISITFLRVPFASLGLGTSDIINYENDIEPNTKTNNWILQNGEWHFYDAKNNEIVNQWFEIDNEWYFFNENGALLQSEWILEKDGYYYVGSDGKMYRLKWLYDNDNYYYFDYDGKLIKSNWIQGQYYVDATGAMLRNTSKTINGEKYIFGQDGIGRKSVSYTNNISKSNNNNKSNSSAKYWYAQNGECYHMKFGCSRATLPDPPRNIKYRPCKKCCY